MSDPLPHPLTGELFTSPVQPGTGWPSELAVASTPRAADADDVRRLAGSSAGLGSLTAAMSVCRACPRLVEWRETIAVDKRKAFADQPYWGRPIAGWGSPTPRVLIVGLAPAAHGGNRTGRVFTGDRSGDWLFASLHRVGLARRPTSEHAGDGQELLDTRMVAAVRCAPPANAPTPAERDTCAPWLDAELGFVLPHARVIVCLGAYGWDAVGRALVRLGVGAPRPRPRFAHGARYSCDGLEVLGSFHPSQQNTFTGKLTAPMLDAVLGDAARLASLA